MLTTNTLYHKIIELLSAPITIGIPWYSYFNNLANCLLLVVDIVIIIISSSSSSSSSSSNNISFIIIVYLIYYYYFLHNQLMTFEEKLMLLRGLSKIGNGQNKNYFHS